MHVALTTLELHVVGLALAILLIDLWTPKEWKFALGYLAAAGVAFVLLLSFHSEIKDDAVTAFGGMYVQDGLALFFKRLFLIAAFFVLLMSVEFAGRLKSGIGEFFTLILFALTGMMFAASANDFIMVFVSLELITVSFYVLVSFQRARLASLEAGVKYLILGALSAAFLVFGIALIFGTANATNFDKVNGASLTLVFNPLFQAGIVLVVVGLAFKLAAFPMQWWAPDVYQGAPTPVTAYLAIGSKAAGVVLLLRVLFYAVPVITAYWSHLLIGLSAVTILYGNLCAIPQRSLKRLLGYSSIANAGYVLIGVAALSRSGSAAILYYLTGYLFTLIAAFTVICLVARDSDDLSVLAGLNQRSPLLAATLTLAMVSLGGIPPLAGFFGKFLLLRAVIEQSANMPVYWWLVGVTVVGVIISLYYYFGVIRAIYWSKDPADLTPIEVSWPMKFSLGICILGMLYLGLFPNTALNAATHAVQVLNWL